jgi:hypothetical protein
MAEYRFVDEQEEPQFRFVDEEPTWKDKALKIGKDALAATPLMAPMTAANIMEKAAYKAGEVVNDQAARVMPIEAAAALGAATNVGVQALPSVVGGPATKMAGPLKSAGRFLMNSALKPSAKQHATGQAKAAVETMLKQGYNPSKGGVEQMQAEIARLNDEIAKSIGGSQATIEKQKVVARLQDLLNKFQMQVNPAADVNAIRAAGDEFMAHPMAPGSQIPVQLAQQMKQGTYKALGAKSYGEQKGAATEAQKAIARGLKEEIAAAVPEVQAMNALESELLNARKIAGHRVAMDANKNPLGLGALISQPWMLPVWMWDRSPAAKGLTARALYSGAEQIPAGLATGGALGYGLSEGMPSDPYLRGILYGQ